MKEQQQDENNLHSEQQEINSEQDPEGISKPAENQASVEDDMDIPEQKITESTPVKEIIMAEEKNIEDADDSSLLTAGNKSELNQHFNQSLEIKNSEERKEIAEPTEETEETDSQISSPQLSAAANPLSIADDDEDEHHNDNDGERDVEMEEFETSEHYTDLDKDEIISRMEGLVRETDPEPVRKKFFALRRAFIDNQKQERDHAYQVFINAGGAIEDYRTPAAPAVQDEKLKELTQRFKQKLTEKREKREKEKQENLAAKRQVIEDLKAVIQNEENILHAFDVIHELQAKWRSIGIVPVEHAEDLWQSYRFYVGKFYDLIRIHKELQELDQKKNLEAKVTLCGQAEDLLLEPSVNRAITQLRELQDKWRDIGPVPKENNEEIWDRFKAVADKIYERRRSHIEGLRSEQEANLVKKTQLCETAEQIAVQKPDKPGEWQKLTDELKQLQQQWRQVGPAPRQQNEKIWHRFRAAGDKHFNDKKDYFSTLKREQDVNKQKKIDICVQAESLKDSTEWRETAEMLKNLQEEWKKIGPVHPKYSQKLWERFRSACDAFFSQRAQHNSEIDKEYTENLNKKTALVEEIEKFEPSGVKPNDLDKLKETQKQWSEIGRVPIKVKDKIYQRYRRALDKCYEKLNLSFDDRRNITSSNRIQQLEQEGRQLSQKDRSSVRYKIDKLQDEIRLLENNIGFFANSKQANKLKEDYERKIELAKTEVQSLKALLAKS